MFLFTVTMVLPALNTGFFSEVSNLSTNFIALSSDFQTKNQHCRTVLNFGVILRQDASTVFLYFFTIPLEESGIITVRFYSRGVTLTKPRTYGIMCAFVLKVFCIGWLSSVQFQLDF